MEPASYAECVDEHKPEDSRPDESGLPQPREVVELLDAMPRAYERAQLGLLQAEAGETVSLDDL